MNATTINGIYATVSPSIHPSSPNSPLRWLLIKELVLLYQINSAMSKEEEKIAKAESDEDDNNDPATKGLTKGQKKKLKEKKKKQEEAAKAKQEQDAKQPKGEDAKEEDPEPKKEEVKGEAKGKDKGKKAPKLNAAALLAKKKQEEQQKFEEEQERLRIEFEKEQERIRLEEEERKRRELQEKLRIAEQAKAEIKRQKKLGIYVKKKDQEKLQRQRQQLQQNRQQAEKEEEQGEQPTEEQIQQMIDHKQKKEKKEESKLLKDDHAYFARKPGEFRSPVCCILGHVDTGKTTLLDKIRHTNVQEGEAGGITQQIGATFFPQDKLVSEVSKCKGFYEVDVNVPGLLIIDTPGHESFSNLRSRGSSLCDIAILVIDLQHGLENQTLQSLELLSKRNTPFVVALNKIDRSYDWKPNKDGSSYLTLKQQSKEALNDYDDKFRKIILELNTKGYNAALYWENEDPSEYISLIPTSGITGEGIPDILSVIVKYATTLPNISKKIKVKDNVFRCTVMEVKMIEGYGTTIDCMLVDGKIKKDDTIVILGFEGPIVTKVKAILTPHPMKEMRIKDEYLHHREIWGANGVKIAANGLDNAVAGTPLIVANSEDEIEDAKAICLNEFENVKKKIKLENVGVGVAASTLGSLQALLEYLSKEKVPVSYVTVGPVSKEDVMKAMKSMLSEIPERRKKEYGCLLVFDVKVLNDAQKYAEENEIKIFTANIIYHLTDFFTKYVNEVREERKIKQGKEAVFPCVLKTIAVFRKSDPIVLGVDVENGVLKIGTPLVIYRQKDPKDPKKGVSGPNIKVGFVESIEHNHKKLKQARKNTGSVAISIGGDPSIEAGKQFQNGVKFVSLISRRSIDCLKEHYREEVTKDEWQLVIELKKYFGIG